MRMAAPTPPSYGTYRGSRAENCHSLSYTANVTLDHNAKEELLWWKTQLQSWNGKAMIYRPNLIMETDASLLGGEQFQTDTP